MALAALLALAAALPVASAAGVPGAQQPARTTPVPTPDPAPAPKPAVKPAPKPPVSPPAPRTYTPPPTVYRPPPVVQPVQPTTTPRPVAKPQPARRHPVQTKKVTRRSPLRPGIGLAGTFVRPLPRQIARPAVLPTAAPVAVRVRRPPDATIATWGSLGRGIVTLLTVLLVLAAIPLVLLVTLPSSTLPPRLLSGRATRRSALALAAASLLLAATLVRLLI